MLVTVSGDTGANSLPYFPSSCQTRIFICVKGNQSLVQSSKHIYESMDSAHDCLGDLKRLLIWPFQLQVPVNLDTTPFWNRQTAPFRLQSTFKTLPSIPSSSQLCHTYEIHRMVSTSSLYASVFWFLFGCLLWLSGWPAASEFCGI
jgi:hypothetical protein